MMPTLLLLATAQSRPPLFAKIFSPLRSIDTTIATGRANASGRSTRQVSASSSRGDEDKQDEEDGVAESFRAFYGSVLSRASRKMSSTTGPIRNGSRPPLTTPPPSGSDGDNASEHPTKRTTRDWASSSSSSSSSTRDGDGDGYDDADADADDDIKQTFREIFGSAMSRAIRTVASSRIVEEPALSLDSSKNGGRRSSSTSHSTTATTNISSSSSSSSARGRERQRSRDKTENYVNNPAITPNALAHSLWSHILRPGIDSAIDATCGNGHDSVFLASTLCSFSFSFSSSSSSSPPSSSLDENSPLPNPERIRSELICIDIQEKACEATRSNLARNVDPSLLSRCDVSVSILHQSHAPLPRPSIASDGGTVGLVCYNLGYLPGSTPEEKRRGYTRTTSTISSMTDAVLMLRVGGMLSVTTYPRSNPNEDYAVHAFMEGLALLSSHEVDWRDFVVSLSPDIPVPATEDDDSDDDDNYDEDDDHHASFSSGDGDDGVSSLSYTVRDAVMEAMERIVLGSGGHEPPTWRSVEHKSMGRALSPILLTATRIK